jgi:dTDP-4-dehydrorhamnose reductase
MFKVRFNLARGENYQKWQIKHKEETFHVDPSSTKLLMINCTLKNNKKVAKKIFQGENKSVCSWILCENLFFEEKEIQGKEIRYNPRKAPFWTDDNNSNLDDKKFSQIQTLDRKLFAKD